jgi:hypothetical protein
LATEYSTRFEERWLSHPPPAELLGNSDFQSLADLSGVYRENIEKLQPLLFAPKDIILLFVVSQLPALPLLLSQVPAQQVLSKLLRLLTGGLPG